MAGVGGGGLGRGEQILTAKTMLVFVTIIALADNDRTVNENVAEYIQEYICRFTRD
jgi:hypothetical protein